MTISSTNPEPGATAVPRPVSGFTLVEILTVLAVIAILVAILVPTVGSVRKKAAISKTRSQFSQYAVAYEMFKAEYGFYPSMGAGAAEFALEGNNDVFVETLTGRTRDGDPAQSGYARQANPKRLRFYTFTEGEFGAPGGPYEDELVDGLENPHLHVVVDRDGDGVIEASDFSALESGRRPDRLRGTVFFYSSNRDNNPDWEWILGWE